MLKIKVKYHKNDIERLSKISIGDWIDLRVAEDYQLFKGDYKLLSLGLSMQLPDGYEAHVVSRSSTFKNFGVLQTNSFGVIDNSYNSDSDLWMYPAYATKDIFIPKNTRLCQFRITKNQPSIEFEEVDTLGNEERGGFGSTGTK